MARVKAAGEGKIIVIVGMGNNSTNGPVIKPAVQKICQERGLVYSSEDGNKGRIVILLEDYEPENGDTLETSGSERDKETTPLLQSRGNRPRVRHSPHNFRVSPYTDRPSPSLHTVTNSTSPWAPLRVTRPPPPRPSQVPLPPSRTLRTAQSSTNSTPYRQALLSHQPLRAPPSRTYQPSQAPRTAQNSFNYATYYQTPPPQHRPLNPTTPLRSQAPSYVYGRYDEEAAGEPAWRSSGFCGGVFKVVVWTLVIGLVWYFLF